MKIIKHIIKEFWIPLIGSIIWTVFNFYSLKDQDKNITTIINIAMPSFFFISWMTGQYFRVKKQTDVADSLSSIETRINGVLDDIKNQSNSMKMITDTQLFQTFDVCLDFVRETKEEMADRNRLFKKELKVEFSQFELYRDNPFYQSKRSLNRLISYSKYTLALNRHDEFQERYTRACYQSEELVGSITSFIGKMNHQKVDWKTVKTDSLLKEISAIMVVLKTDILPYSRYSTKPYKGSELVITLDTHIESLNKFSKD